MSPGCIRFLAPPWRLGALAVASLLFVTACDRGTPAKPASPPAPPPPKAPTLFLPESLAWSRADAVGRLSDPKVAVSAAVRLIRLGEVQPLCVPEQAGDGLLSRLAVVKLSDNGWALGIVDRRDARLLYAPVLIEAEGDVLPVAEGVEEEVTTLYVSKDAEVFPHLLIMPTRVLVADVPPRPALTLKSLDVPPALAFRRRVRDRFSYIGLMLHGAQGWVEAGQYVWDPYELVFTGPACDKLPDPPGGKFELDLEASPLLMPVGGEIPKPKAATQPTPPEEHRPPWDEA